MYNLPTDASMNGLMIYNEGNHFDKGNPHNNYISKFSYNYTLNTKEDSGKISKIATIKYTPNNNVDYKFIIGLFTTGTYEKNEMIILCGKSIDTIKCKFIGEDFIDVIIKKYQENNKIIVDVYLKINRKWIKMYYSLKLARCLDYLNIYTEETAYNSIKFYNESILEDNVISDIEIEYTRNVQIVFYDNEEITISGNDRHKMLIPVKGLKTKSLISFIPVGAEIPTEINIMSYGIPYDGYLVVKFSNTANYSKAIPKLKWNISFRNLV